MKITKQQLRRIIRESFEWTPEMKAKWKESLDTDRRNYEHVHGVGRMNPDVVYDQLSKPIKQRAFRQSGETYLSRILDQLENDDIHKAALTVMDALWITDVPVGAEEDLEKELMIVDNEDALAAVVANWVPRYWKVNDMGRIMGRK